MRRRGFTLVELLVVIGIIALLIALLMPALIRARDSARTVACLSGVRQIGMAWLSYANENHDYLVASWDGETATSWTDRLDVYISKTRDQPIYVCPAAVAPQDFSSQFPLTYGLNCSAFTFRQIDPSTGGYTKLSKLSSITRPSEIVGIADTAQASGVWTCGGWISGSDIWYNDPIAANDPLPVDNSDVGDYHIRYRHNANKYCDIAYLDGHGEAVFIGSLQYKNICTLY